MAYREISVARQDTLEERGGIKHNATTNKPQIFDTVNKTWVDLPVGGGGGASPTLVVVNKNETMNNKDVTVKSSDNLFNQTKNMGANNYLIFELPWLGDYIVSYLGHLGETITLNVNVPSVGGVTVEASISYPSFAAATDAQVSQMVALHYQDQIDLSTIWSVGDTRKLSLSSMQAPNPNSSQTWAAQDITITILDFNHTDLATPINGHTKAALTLQTREVLNNNSQGYNQAGHIYVNGDSSNDMTFTKWSNLYMRTYMNDKVFNAFPSEIKSAIKPSKHYRHTTYNGTASEQVIDNLFLPSYPEIFGTASYGSYVATNPVEGTQFKYYETAANRIKNGNNNGVSNGVAQYWWEGSASSFYYSSYGYYWCYVDTSGSANFGYGTAAFGLAPAFAM